MSKAVAILVAVCCLSIGFLAGRFSMKNDMSKTTALVPSKLDSRAGNSYTAIGSNVTFEDVVIGQQGPTATSAFASFTLRGKWTNKNPSPVTVFYDVHFYDNSGVELYSDGRYRDIDANAATVAPQVVGTFEGKASDKFDYRAVKNVAVKFRIKGSDAEKIVVSNIPIRLIE